MIELDGITVRFGALTAVDQVSFSLADDQILGLVGPNGSGKSTLLNAVTGAVGASGSVTLDGEALPLGRPTTVARRGIARTFQTPQIIDELTCLENVLLQPADRSFTGLTAAWLRRHRMLRCERERWAAGHAALEQVGMGAHANARGDTLSYGQRRFVELARAFVAEPRVVLLDEPAAGLNEMEAARLAELIREFRRRVVPVIVVEHKIDFINQLCDTLIVLELGRVIARGEPATVWADRAVIDAYLGIA